MRNMSWVFLLGLIACYPAGAAQMTVADLQKLCTNPIEEGRVACSFYIWGVTEGADLGGGSEEYAPGKFREKSNKTICLPESVGKSDMQQIVTDAIARDLVRFPEDSTMPAVSFVMGVVARKFPCGGQ